MTTVDSKFAHLPYIDRAGCDVYECGEIIPEEQDGAMRTRPNGASAVAGHEDISTVSVDIRQSFDKFRADEESTKSLSEYEILPRGHRNNESVSQRLIRLQQEVEELQQQVRDASRVPIGADQSASQLLPRITNLSNLLLHMKIDEMTMCAASNGAPGSSSRFVDQLKSENFIRMLSAATSGATPDVTGKYSRTAAEGGEAVQDVKVVVRQASDLVTPEQFAALDKRLKCLESLIGFDHGRPSVVSNELQGQGLLASVGQLSSKLSLLDAKQLDQIESRLSGVHLQLTHLADKKKVALAQDKEAKVSQLYDMTKRLSTVAEQLPQIHNRLQVLNELHVRAMQFSQALNQLDASQKAFETRLLDSRQTLDTLQSAMTDNFSQIGCAVQQLTERLQRLEQKLS